VPEAPGVYVVFRESLEPPSFLRKRRAGPYKGQDPTVPVEELKRHWVPGARVLYIGKAGGPGIQRGLHSRLREYARGGFAERSSRRLSCRSLGGNTRIRISLNRGPAMNDLPTIDPALGAHEGMIDFRGYRVWYAIVGEEQVAGKLPLLCLHGGPGAAHDYLESLAEIAKAGRRVIFYDQLGCGNSDQPDNPSLWTVPLFREEVGVVRRALGLDRFHLLGQSWGGMLAMEYALTQPSGVASLTIASSPASMIQWVAEANRLRRNLPADVQTTLEHHEAAGTTDSSEYQSAMMVFYRRHVIRVDPMPEFVARSFAKLERNPQVYRTMNGPSEFFVVGTLKDWDIVARLSEIGTPTLVTSGRHDEATPLIAETVHRGIRGSQWVVFENSSHMAHAEEPDRYMTVLDEFLCYHEPS